MLFISVGMESSQSSVLVLLVLLQSIHGCSANSGPVTSSADLSKPKTAVLTYLHAIARGNAATAKSASIGTDQDKQQIDGKIALINGLRHYDQAIVSRFGPSAVSTDIELRQALTALADDPVMRFEGAIVKEAEDTAEVDPALNGMRLAAHSPILLRKQNGLWKVDLPAMREDSDQASALSQQYLAAGKALEDAAKAVGAGRYKTLEQARQAIAERVPR